MITAAPEAIARTQASVLRPGSSASSSRRSTTLPRQLVINCSSTRASNLCPPSKNSVRPSVVSPGERGTVGSYALWVLTGQLRVAYASSKMDTSYRLARCRATMPPDRLRHSTSRQPAAMIRSARPDWSGHAWIDSARYS